MNSECLILQLESYIKQAIKKALFFFFFVQAAHQLLNVEFHTHDHFFSLVQANISVQPQWISSLIMSRYNGFHALFVFFGSYL